MKHKSARALGYFLAATMVFGSFASTASAALTEAQITAILGLLSSFGAEQSVIDNVDASLRGQATSGTSAPSAAVCPFTWTRSLTSGSTGDDVKALQQFLNGSSDTTVASSGVGSLGNETTYFGSLTGTAVAAFQDKYASEVLTPIGLTSGTGYFGTMTRAKANELCATGSTTTTTDDGTTVIVPAGTGLSVVAGVQPLNTLAPENASRIPFTNFTVTAGSDGDVVMDSVTIERRGLSSNAALSGIVLIGEDGTQYGLSKTLNSNNQAKIGEKVTIPAGTSRTFTIAGNTDSDVDAQAGEVISLALIGINTSATVTGSLPIIGASHTMNATLSLGTVTAARGALDPNSASNKEVGTTGHVFAAIKLTAGSAEDVRIRSIRFNQSGSASASDLTNITISVDGVAYATTVSSDGNYYTANFPGGLLLKEGLTKDISIKGDIVDGSDRTVVMDIYQATDVYVTGETFGYGITPTATTGSASASTSEFLSGTPWFDASHTTVGTGSLTVSSTNDVPAGNIAEGTAGVSLGSFKFDVQGEEVSWTQIALTVATNTGGGGELITNVTLVDQNGSVLAGPQDPNAAGDTVTFSDTITLPVGVTIITVKGTLDNDWENDDTIIISFNPATAISTLTGGTSGQTLTATPSATVTGKTQTVKAAALTVTPDSSLVSQNIINDSNGAVLGRYVLDASASGEDLRITTIQFQGITGTNADLDELNTMQLFDGNTALNTGSNIVNPSGHTGAADANITFTIDSGGLTIAKGTSKVIELRANVAASSTPTNTTTFIFDFSTGSPGWTVTGVNTGTDVGETLTATGGPLMTVVGSGTLTATVSTADPVEKWYVAGSTATVGIFRFTGTNEPQAVTDLSLTLDTASSSSADILEVSLWDGSTLLRTIISPFVTSNKQSFDLPTSGAGSFIVPKSDNKDLTVKVKFAQVGTDLAGASGNWVKVATSSTAADNKALGTNSGTSANILGSAGSTVGAKYFRSLPTLAKLTVSNTKLANGTQEVYKFSVTADAADDIAIYKFTFTVATTSADLASFSLTEIHSGKVVANSSNGMTVSSTGTNVDAVVNSTPYGAAFITIPAGQTYTYQLKATVTNANATGDSVQIYLNDDSGVAILATDMASATDVDGQAEDNFIWSPISDGGAALADVDWINGYKVSGIESDNLGTEVISY